MTKNLDSLFNYRPGIGALIVHPQGDIWVGNRVNVHPDILQNPLSSWQMPQGGMDMNETPEDAVLREVYEEIGIQFQITDLKAHTDWLAYDFPPHLVPTLWNGKYKGQKQIWYHIPYTGSDSAFNLIPPTHTQEFKEWAWWPPKKVLESVVDFKKNLYHNVFQALLGINT